MKSKYYFSVIVRLILITKVFFAVCSSMIDWSTCLISILLILDILKKLLFKRLPERIDLNRVEDCLNNIQNITQVISLELAYLTPKIKLLHINLSLATDEKIACDALKKQIKSELWEKFGVTETLIDITSLVNNIDTELYSVQKIILGEKYNTDSINICIQPYINRRTQTFIDLN